MGNLFISAFNIMGRTVHENAEAKGFWQGERNAGEAVALMHSELSEALEAMRRPAPPTCSCGAPWALKGHGLGGEWQCVNGHVSPCNPAQASAKLPGFSEVEEEFADVVIRLMDFAHAHKLRVAEAIVAKAKYNEGRPHKHGKTF